MLLADFSRGVERSCSRLCKHAYLPVRRDVWVSLLFVLAMVSTLILGLVHWSRGNTETPLIISLVYMIYNLVPQCLLLQVGSEGGLASRLVVGCLLVSWGDAS